MVTEGKESVAAAEAVFTKAYPKPIERHVVLKQLLDSSAHADKIAPGAWAVTLKPKGFRLNVGVTEVLVGFPAGIGVNLAGRPDEFEASGGSELVEVNYAFRPGSTRYNGFVADFAQIAPGIQKAHFAFIGACALSSSGKPYKGSVNRRFHNPGLMAYARSFVADYGKTLEEQTIELSTDELVVSPDLYEAMEHFVAYHSVRQMGRTLEPDGKFHFLSRKLGLLKRAVGSTVWIVQGLPDGKRTLYSLEGAYIAESVQEVAEKPGLFGIRGQIGTDFHPPILLNDLGWFPSLLKTQSNFSLGFNRVSDVEVLEALVALRGRRCAPITNRELPDIDLHESAVEGTPRLVAHLRRERSRKLVEAKKAAVLAAGIPLACEACGFDFSRMYGSWGKGFCEIHHKVPIAKSDLVTATSL